jgi:hypothetical protein
MIAIYNPAGVKVEVDWTSVSTWQRKGWTLTPPGPVVTSAELLVAVAPGQPSDVTAPGESKVEGITAPPVQASAPVAQDEE